MDYVQLPGNQLVKFDDICVIHVSDIQRYVFKVEPKGEIQTKFGQIKAEDLINHPFGVRFQCKRGWVLPLRLTPEIWTQLLPHRTQILYPADISMILLQLDIKPGSIIVESGTGSGSLSHALLRACRPNGFLHTFEVNAFRAEEARLEFIEHGFGDNVKVTNHNVCELGFSDDLIGKVDACILDLPQTWSAIEHAYKVLKPYGSRLCTFSPCIEQVKNNVAKMTELKMKDIVTMETLLLPYEVKTQNLRLWTDDVLKGLTVIDKKRFKNLAETLDAKTDITVDSGSDSLQEEIDFEQCVGDGITLSADDEINLRKALYDPKAPFQSNMLPKKSSAFARHHTETISHSGYLTFASKRP